MSNPQLGDPTAVQKAASLKAVADIEAAKVKAEGVKTAETVKGQADDAREERRQDANAASDVRKYDFYKAVMLALIVAAPATIAAWRTGDLRNDVKEYHHEVNSMKDELVEAVKKTARAEGVAEGKAEKGK